MEFGNRISSGIWLYYSDNLKNNRRFGIYYSLGVGATVVKGRQRCFIFQGNPGPGSLFHSLSFIEKNPPGFFKYKFKNMGSDEW